MSAPIKPSAFLGATELVLSTSHHSASKVDLSPARNRRKLGAAQRAGLGFSVAIVFGSAFWLTVAGWAWSLA